MRRGIAFLVCTLLVGTVRRTRTTIRAARRPRRCSFLELALLDDPPASARPRPI
jgi:hypothetical protein